MVLLVLYFIYSYSLIKHYLRINLPTLLTILWIILSLPPYSFILSFLLHVSMHVISIHENRNSFEYSSTIACQMFLLVFSVVMESVYKKPFCPISNFLQFSLFEFVNCLNASNTFSAYFKHRWYQRCETTSQLFKLAKYGFTRATYIPGDFIIT